MLNLPGGFITKYARVSSVVPDDEGDDGGDCTGGDDGGDCTGVRTGVRLISGAVTASL